MSERMGARKKKALNRFASNINVSIFGSEKKASLPCDFSDMR